MVIAGHGELGTQALTDPCAISIEEMCSIGRTKISQSMRSDIDFDRSLFSVGNELMERADSSSWLRTDVGRVSMSIIDTLVLAL